MLQMDGMMHHGKRTYQITIRSSLEAPMMTKKMMTLTIEAMNPDDADVREQNAEMKRIGRSPLSWLESVETSR